MPPSTGVAIGFMTSEPTVGALVVTVAAIAMAEGAYYHGVIDASQSGISGGTTTVVDAASRGGFLLPGGGSQERA